MKYISICALLLLTSCYSVETKDDEIKKMIEDLLDEDIERLQKYTEKESQKQDHKK